MGNCKAVQKKGGKLYSHVLRIGVTPTGKVKNLEEKYAKYEEFLVYHPEACKGNWQERVRKAGCTGLYLETGKYAVSAPGRDGKYRR